MKVKKNTIYGTLMFLMVLTVLENIALIIYSGLIGVLFTISTMTISALIVVLIVVSYIIVKEIRSYIKREGNI
ncbi:MAG: hypothetical protein ACFFCV_07105 [Promethearchaeota archaeon]